MTLDQIQVPAYVVDKMKYLGIESLPTIKNLAMEYIIESEVEDYSRIDWYYFSQWVAMGNSDH
jgi:hypothetical protein